MEHNELDARELQDDEGLANGSGSRALARSSHPRRSKRRRIILLAFTLVLGFLALVTGIQTSLGLAVFPLPSSSPTPTRTAIPPAIAAAMTATAQAQDFKMLEQRAVQLPTIAAGSPCPLSPRHPIPYYGLGASQGPIYLAIDATGTLGYTDAAHFQGGGSAWGGATGLFVIAPAYRGPALIRGRQIDDGLHEMRFQGGVDEQDYPGQLATAPLLSELKVSGTGRGFPWANALVYIRLQAPGCYAIQVDGLSFSYAIVFHTT